MFDVHYTDPSRETVGQRKIRKESKTSEISRGSSIRSSNSSESSQSHTRPALLSLFGGGSSKRGALTRTGSQSKLSALKNGDASKASRRISSYTVASDSSVRDFTEPSANQASSKGTFSFDQDTDLSCASEPAESVFSGWTGRSSNTNSTWGSVVNSPTTKSHLIQPLSPTSIIGRGPDVSTLPRENASLAGQVATVVTIPPRKTIPIQGGDSPTDPARNSATFDFPVPHFFLPEKQSTPTKKIFDLNNPPPTPPPAFSVPPLPQLPIRTDSHRPPMRWAEQRRPEDIPVPKLLQPPIKLTNVKRQRPVRLVHSHLQKGIRRMEAASSKIILERLKEEWVEVADASVYRELELEKQRWMLFALRDLKTTRLGPQNETSTIQLTTAGATKVLSLYENHASASFLSALSSPSTEVHHLSKSPLSPKPYPNIHPLSVPDLNTQLPYTNNTFTSIHAFSLPAQFPASSIPGLLKECHRLLTPSPPSPTNPSLSPESISPTSPSFPTRPEGILHLTIIDPCPLPSTLGPLLRTWLDNHLLLNLEKQFRCINPSRLFPEWLRDAGLRAEGSCILTVPFLAVVDGAQAESILLSNHHNSSTPSTPSPSSSSDTSPTTETDEPETQHLKIDKNDIIKQELKSVVGRMLWKEMWGSFVEARGWWWEDEGIVEECGRLRTCWEWSVVDAVKG
ncbi:hypothetical protein HYFRA_00012576 [Hymenoscyphus fraxineus]|uniref:Uncharacterized protein n=1 Tax=Hymenoscyphus fraxineus TaxID=746836 RepID=A0A9N9L715_9HELO|nr:hypothetical protein HYFRA_00012576 [Hymenoscyphus fraxineus]